MDAVPIFRMLVTGTLILAALLLSLPVIQVAKSAQPWRGVIGLWVSGWGFLLIGVGLHFADRGYGGVVLLGVATAGVGHFLQSRNNRRRGSGK
jgi:hypothetical protein